MIERGRLLAGGTRGIDRRMLAATPPGVKRLCWTHMDARSGFEDDLIKDEVSGGSTVTLR